MNQKSEKKYQTGKLKQNVEMGVYRPRDWSLSTSPPMTIWNRQAYFPMIGYRCSNVPPRKATWKYRIWRRTCPRRSISIG